LKKQCAAFNNLAKGGLVLMLTDLDATACAPEVDATSLPHMPNESRTRESRMEQCIPRIPDGKGIHDCTCGLYKKMPACDGSHKFP